MKPACTNTKNRAFINPAKAPHNSIEAALKMCHACPLLKHCASQALTSGTSLSEDCRAPAADVIQAGVICHGDLDTAYKLAAVAQVDVPAYLVERTRRDNIGARRPDRCRNCNRPMIKWNRHEEQPEGYQMHYARGFCTACRSAYVQWKKEHPTEQRGLRKPIDRKRHSAPPRKRGAVTIQPTLFEIPA